MDSKLAGILRTVFNLTEQEFGEHLAKDDVSGWDSLKHMELVVTLEKEYGISLEMQEIVALQSVPDIVALLRARGAIA